MAIWMKPAPKTFSNQYDNVHACSSKQVAAFVNWVKSQPFYENTTIIISGDHLGMQTSYYDEKIGGTNYQRTIYNTFINPAISTSHSKNRQFTTFDMYPSTLAALGVEIDGDRLGLGTNLFSGKKTLVEQYGGIENLDSELSKRSAYTKIRFSPNLAISHCSHLDYCSANSKRRGKHLQLSILLANLALSPPSLGLHSTSQCHLLDVA